MCTPNNHTRTKTCLCEEHAHLSPNPHQTRVQEVSHCDHHIIQYRPVCGGTGRAAAANVGQTRPDPRTDVREASQAAVEQRVVRRAGADTGGAELGHPSGTLRQGSAAGRKELRRTRTSTGHPGPAAREERRWTGDSCGGACPAPRAHSGDTFGLNPREAGRAAVHDSPRGPRLRLYLGGGTHIRTKAHTQGANIRPTFRKGLIYCPGLPPIYPNILVEKHKESYDVTDSGNQPVNKRRRKGLLDINTQFDPNVCVDLHAEYEYVDVCSPVKSIQNYPRYKETGY